MTKFYDWAEDEKSGVGREWVTARDLGPAEVVRRADASVEPRVNAVNGHVLGCRCAQCPGWYQDRAQMASAAPADTGTSPAPAPRPGRPLADQVVPVAVLMVVFTICAMVLLPLVTPMVALMSLSLGLVVVAICVVAVVALLVLRMVRQTAREASEPRVIKGRVLKR